MNTLVAYSRFFVFVDIFATSLLIIIFVLSDFIPYSFSCNHKFFPLLTHFPQPADSYCVIT